MDIPWPWVHGCSLKGHSQQTEQRDASGHVRAFAGTRSGTHCRCCFHALHPFVDIANPLPESVSRAILPLFLLGPPDQNSRPGSSRGSRRTQHHVASWPVHSFASHIQYGFLASRCHEVLADYFFCITFLNIWHTSSPCRCGHIRSNLQPLAGNLPSIVYRVTAELQGWTFRLCRKGSSSHCITFISAELRSIAAWQIWEQDSEFGSGRILIKSAG